MKRTKARNPIQLIILVISGISVVLTLSLPEIYLFKDRYVYREISILQKEQNPEFFSNTRMGMEQAAIDLGVNLRFISLNQDDRSQSELINRELQGGTNGLIIIPTNPEALNVSLKDNPIDIPMLTIESELDSGIGCIYPENEEIGESLANACLQDNTRGTILLLDTSEENEDMAKRIEACDKILKENGMETEVYKITVQEISERKYLPKAAAVICFEVAATEALAKYSEVLSLTHDIYGVGTTTSIAMYLEREIIDAAVVWSDYAVGYLAIETVLKAIKDDKVYIPQINIHVVRGDNIYEPEHQKLLFPVN